MSRSTSTADKAAPAKPAPQAADATATLPISKRSIDLLMSFWFLMFAFSTTFTDLHNFTASIKGVEVKDLEGADLLWPPKVLTDVYFKWARTVDPLLYANPVWWQCIEWVNLLCLTPFAFIAVLGFLRGWNWLRLPAIIVSSFTFYSLILCIGTTLYGPDKSADPGTFTGIYLIYLTQPPVVIARLWKESPFSRSGLSPRANAVLSFLTLANMALFFSYVLKWLVLHMDYIFPASLLPILAQAKALP